jgi:hypothetical protein
MPANHPPGPNRHAVKPAALAGASAWHRIMTPWVRLGLLAFLVCSPACRKAAHISETYSVDVQQNQLVTGQEQKREIVVRYLRSERLAVKLKYKVQFSAPGDLTVTPAAWEVERDLTTNEAGFNYTGLVSLEVAAGAAPGPRQVTVTITPVQGPASTATLVFHVR